MQLALLPAFAESFVLAFARIGALIMLLPGVGERAIPARLRLAVALLLTLLLLPGIQSARGAPLVLLATELALGAVIGLSTRLALMAAEAAGSFAAQGIGLSFAQTLDPTQGQQGDALAALFRMIGVMVVFWADLHHLAIAGIAGSYQALPQGVIASSSDAMDLNLRSLGLAFLAAVMLAAPFLVFGLVFNLGVALVGRMAPQIQVFFLAIPVSVAVGLALLGGALPLIGETFRRFAAVLLGLIPVLP